MAEFSSACTGSSPVTRGVNTLVDISSTPLPYYDAMTLKGFLVGMLFIIGGGLIIYFHRQLYQLFGNIERAEKAMGDSRAIYPLMGACLVVLGVLLMFGIGAGEPTEIGSGFGE